MKRLKLNLVKLSAIFLAVFLTTIFFMFPMFNSHNSQVAEANTYQSGTFTRDATQLIRKHWRDDYFSSITMTLGENKLVVDGKETNAEPAEYIDGELVLPIADIAGAIGGEIIEAKSSDAITIKYDGEKTELDDTNNRFYKNRPKPNKPHRRSFRKNIEDGLNVEINITQNKIQLTNAYQSKGLIVRTKKNQKLNDTFGAEAVINDGNGLHYLQFTSQKKTKYANTALNKLAYVEFSEPNGIVKTNSFETNTSNLTLADRWGSERIAADRFKTYLNQYGKTDELLVAVTDTGLDINHPFVKNRIKTDLSYSYIDNNKNVTDENDHGTHVTGTIIDCTPDNVKVIPIKVLGGKEGTGTDLQVTSGIRYAADNGAKVINMSLGGTYYGGEIRTYKDAMDYALSKGVMIVAAAGNENADTKYVFPAKYSASHSNVVTVAATDKNNQRASFSNYGSAVDVAAPGVSIYSTIPNNKYMYMNGTSMAAPHVSASIGMLILDNKAASPSKIKQLLRETTANGGNFRNDYLGTGTVDLNYFSYPKENKPVASIDFFNEKLTGLSAGEYIINNKSITLTESSLAILLEWFGTSLSIIKKGSGVSITDSQEQILTIPLRPDTPDISGGKGFIDGISPNMEFRKDMALNWMDFDDSLIFESGKYYVRFKATDSSFASLSTEVKVKPLEDEFDEKSSPKIVEDESGAIYYEFFYIKLHIRIIVLLILMVYY